MKPRVASNLYVAEDDLELLVILPPCPPHKKPHTAVGVRNSSTGAEWQGAHAPENTYT